ncbi:MAG TPA: zinc-ribbon domain-containing protein [Candidatus Bathyarchaeia archaeon]|nr:zinc-ribbon domain-containing protein [Candidatus Bathyarchaeia archaeon]
MTNRGVATVLNVVLWGSGYIYSKRGLNGAFAILAHLSLYFWTFLLGFAAWAFWAPLLILGGLYFAIDGHKYAGPRELAPKPGSSAKQKGICVSCGRSISPKSKFCPECGASQTETEPKPS